MRLLFKIFLLSIVSAVFISCGGGGGGAAPQPVPGTLQFSASDYTIDEDGSGSAVITVTRSGGDDGAVGVSYATEDGFAVAGSDYTAVSGTLNWADGDSSAKSFTVPITDDKLIETPETVRLSLRNPTGGASLGTSNATLTITSEDSHGQLRFSATSYNVNETDATAVITLQRVNGSVGDVSVDLSDLGTGSAGVNDYSFASPVTLSWPDGVSGDQTVNITLLDDGDPDGTKTIKLSLDANTVSGGAVIGTPAAATVYIADNETLSSPGQLHFDSATYAVAEDGGSITITVLRSNGTDGAASVDYATTGVSATEGNDYTGVSDTLTWAAGEGGAKTFTVPITNDALVEGDETIELTLSNVTGDPGISLGTPSTATLTILYNDTNLTMAIGDGTYWVAFQDGAGDWNEWSPTSGNVYDFPVTDSGERYGVVFHRQETDGVDTVQKVYVIQATLAELDNMNMFNSQKYTVSGTLNNYIDGADLGGAFMYLSGSGEDNAPFPYVLPGVSAGLRDFIAYQQVGTADPNKIVVRRGIDMVADVIDMDVDFSTDPAVEDLQTTPRDFTGGKDNYLEVYYSTEHGTSFNIASDTYDGVTPVKYSYMSNASLTMLGDVYSFQSSSDTGDKYRIRNVGADGGDPGNRDLKLGNLEALSGTAVSNTQTTGLDYAPNPASLNGAPVLRAYQIDLDQSVTSGIHWQFKVSAGWLDTNTSYSYPDLAGISGFQPGWDLNSGNVDAAVSTATTQNGRGSLNVVIRKTSGLDSKSLNPDSWTIAQKLAHNNRLRLDIAREFHPTVTW